MQTAPGEINDGISVSIVISTYNRAEYLSQALESVLAQSRAPDEVILIDDGSTDATPEVAARYADRIRYFRRRNQGKPAALNFAIPQTTGSHICIFDDDDVMLVDALRHHVDFLESNPGIDYSYGRNLVYDDDGRSGEIWNESTWRSGETIECPPEELFLRTMEWNGVYLQSMLIPRRCLTAVGLFSEALLRGEDYDMMLKLARCYRGASVGQDLFVWRNHRGTRGPAAERHHDRDRYAVFHHYERRIFRQLRRDVALAEYLPRADDARSTTRLSPEQRVCALLQRSRVMFGRGLFAEGAEDVQLLLLEPTLDAQQTRDLIDLVRNTANIGHHDYIQDAPRLAFGLCVARRGAHGKAVVDAAIKGLYWSLLQRLRQERVSSAWYLGRALTLLMVNRAIAVI